MTKQPLRIAVFLVFASAVFAQATSQRAVVPTESAEKWVRLQSRSGDFSILLPEGFFVAADAEGFVRSDPVDWRRSTRYSDIKSASIYSRGLEMFVERYKVGGTKRGLDFLMPQPEEAEVKGFAIGNVEMRQVAFTKIANYVVLYFEVGSEIYAVGTASREPNNPMQAKFLGSIVLGGKPIFDTKAVTLPDAARAATFDDLAETPVDVVEDLIKQDKANSPQPAQQVPPVKDETVKPVVILMKPKASYTDKARRSNEQGYIRLRVAFQPDGGISKITVQKKLRYGLLENTIRAAKRIKFIPPEKDGAALARELTFEYGFSIY